jgi:large subunit ribosomal protein L24
MKIRKGDTIQIITGKDKGKTGKVLRIDSAKGRVWVERLNMVKRHQRPTQVHRQGGIIEKEAPLSISNVMYYDEKSAKPSRIGFRVEKGDKVRFAKRSGEVISISK